MKRNHQSYMATYLNTCFCFCSLTVFTGFLIQFNSETHTALFIFGDSLFDPRAIEPRNNSSRTCNYGRIFPDFIGLTLISPYWNHVDDDGRGFVQGSNFACWGAGAIHGGEFDLKMQSKQFQNVTERLKHKLGEAKATKIISNAVYMFSIGTNDYRAYYEGDPPLFTYITPENYVSMVIQNVTFVVKEIYKEGARKFAFMSLLPIGCLPYKRLETLDCNTNFTKLARLHNEAFSKVLKGLQDEQSGFKFSIFDFFNTSKQRINHPSKYGFKEGKRACCTKEGKCCDDPCAYVFINNHPSEKANEQFAQLAWNGTRHEVAPYNFKTLFRL